MTETTPKDNTKLKTMLSTLGRKVDELKDSDQWKAMLKVAAKFHRYSASNQLMIYMQNPEATQVAGFRQWQSMGRQVRKGERSIKIFAPMTKKDVDGETKLFGFKLVSVFDIGQTDGEALPTVEWPAAGECPPNLWDTLSVQVEAHGLLIERVVDGSVIGTPGARGWYVRDTRTIYVREAPEPSMCATLLHEVGHALDPDLADDASRARRELVAESAAYVLGLRYGVALEDEVTHYIASWGGGVDELVSITDRVKQIVGTFDSPPSTGVVTMPLAA